MAFVFFSLYDFLSEYRCRGHDSEWTSVVRLAMLNAE